MPDHLHRRVCGIGALGIVLVGVLLTGCVGTPGATPRADDTGTTAPAAPPEPSPSMVEITPAPSLSPAAPQEDSVAPRTEDSDVEGRLRAVTARSEGDRDTLTFTFEDGAVPGYDIRFVDRVERDNGDALMLEGSAALTVTLTRSTPSVDGAIAEDVVTNEAYDLPVIRQVLLATNVAGTVVFGIGTSWQGPFTVSVDGSDLVVSFQHEQ